MKTARALSTILSHILYMYMEFFWGKLFSVRFLKASFHLFTISDTHYKLAIHVQCTSIPALKTKITERWQKHTIKAINLCDLSTFMISSQKCNAIRPSAIRQQINYEMNIAENNNNKNFCYYPSVLLITVHFTLRQ